MDENLSSRVRWQVNHVCARYVHVNRRGKYPSPRESRSPYNTRPPLRSISRFLRINTSPPWEHAHPVPVDEWLRHPPANLQEHGIRSHRSRVKRIFFLEERSILPPLIVFRILRTLQSTMSHFQKEKCF